MKRTVVTIEEDGTQTTSTFDVDWDEVRFMRRGLIEELDLWYFADRWAQLTTEQQNALNTIRQTLRDLPSTYSTANEAFDNFPEPEDWMVPNWR